MKRTPLLTPPLEKPKNLKITYLRGMPGKDEGNASDIVVDVTDGNRYVNTRRGWESADFGPLRVFIDATTLRDAGIVATGEFRERAIMELYEKLFERMRATGTTSCHYEDGDLVAGWAR